MNRTHPNVYGTFIVNHLIDEATVTVAETGDAYQPTLFLDVYESNTRAISLYERCGFQKTRPQPICNDGNFPPYFIMGLNVSVAA